MQFLRFRRFVRERLHWQMEHHLKTAAMCFRSDLHRVLVIGQNGNSQGITQSEDSFGGGAVAAQIVDNDGKARVCSISAGIHGSRTGPGWCTGNDFDFDRRQALMWKLESEDPASDDCALPRHSDSE